MPDDIREPPLMFVVLYLYDDVVSPNIIHNMSTVIPFLCIDIHTYFHRAGGRPHCNQVDDDGNNLFVDRCCIKQFVAQQRPDDGPHIIIKLSRNHLRQTRNMFNIILPITKQFRYTIYNLRIRKYLYSPHSTPSMASCVHRKPDTYWKSAVEFPTDGWWWVRGWRCHYMCEQKV